MTDSTFDEQYRRHAANCFRRVGTSKIIDGCLPGGPPLFGCDVGESLHRLATRKQETVHHEVCLREMRA